MRFLTSARSKWLLTGAAALTVLFVAGVAMSQTGNDAKNLKIDQAIATLEEAKAIPADTVTVTTTETITIDPPPSDPTCAGVQVPAGASLASLNDGISQTYCLAAGTYNVPVTVQLESDTVIGAGRDLTFIVGTGAQNLFTADTGAVWEFRSLDISGGVGDANANCSPECGRAFIGVGDQLTIDDVRCHGNDNQCIGSGSADVSFLNSECDHNGNAAFAAATNRSTSCIKRVRGGSSNINTVVRNSNFHDNYWSAIWFDFYEGTATIEDNTFTDNGKAGVQIEVTGGFNAADNILVQNNTFHGNGLANVSPVKGGVICANCADTLVQTNTFGNNSAAVAFVKSAREWGGYINVRVLNNTLNVDSLSCPTPGVTCSGNS